MTTSAQSTVESHTRAFHADRSHQAATLEQQSDQSTCEFQPSMSCEQSAFENKQWQARGTRFQQPKQRSWTTASFRSCEHTDQEAAQVASALPRQLFDVKTKLMVIRQTVDRNRARWIRLRCEWLSRRTILPASEESR